MKAITGNRRQSPFGRGFAIPHVIVMEYGYDYYKIVCYKCFLSCVFDEINEGFYEIRIPTTMFRDTLPEKIDLTASLAYHVSLSPDLFQSDNAIARKLIAHLGKKVWQYHHGKTNKERLDAKDEIEEMLFNKHPYAKWSKFPFPLPPLLAVRDLFEHLHKITQHLREAYVSNFESDSDQRSMAWLKNEVDELKAVDPRLSELATNNKITMLLQKPKELTYKILADFFHVKPSGLKQYLKEEKKHLKSLGHKAQ